MRLRAVLVALALASAPTLVFAQTSILYSQIHATAIGTNQTVVIAGNLTAGDPGTGAIYASGSQSNPACVSGVPRYVTDVNGVGFCLQFKSGVADVGWFGAYGDAMFAFFTGAVTASPCTLTVSGIGSNGVIRASDNLIGDGVTPGGTILAFGTNSTTGTGGNGTYALSTCTANPTPSITGSLAPTVGDPTTSTLTVTATTGTLAINQTLTDSPSNHLATNTQIISQLTVTGGTPWKTGTYLVSQGNQTVASETMATTLHMQTYGGHDDWKAVQAAATTGNDVILKGPPPQNGVQLSYFGMLWGVTLPAQRQKISMESARFLALPGFGVTRPPGITTPSDYVVTLNAARQTAERVFIDGGAMIGTQFVGGLQCAGESDLVNNIEVFHHSTIGLDLSNACVVNSKEIQQWNNFEPQLNQWSLTAIGEYYNHADTIEIGGSSFWNKSNHYMDCASGTLMLQTLHPFNGNPSGGNGGGPFHNPENMHFAGCAGDADLIDGFYQDDGAVNNFGVRLSIRNQFPEQSNTLSVFSNNCFINEYANGSTGQSSQDYRLWLPGGLSGNLATVCHNDNPNLASSTSASASAPATISSGTYNSGNGQVVLTLATSTVVPVGGTFIVSGATGTGAYASINGTQTATATTGTTVTFSIASGLGATTITGGSFSSDTVTLTLAASPAVNVVGVLADGTNVRYRVAWWPAGHPLVGDQVTVSNVGTGYNGTFTVATANPFYVTVANTTMGAFSLSASSTIQPTSAWTSDNPMPAVGTTSGYINITGTPTCSRCKVRAVTANSISFSSNVTTGFVNGSVQEAWAGDYSGLPALQPNFYPGSVEAGDFVHTCTYTLFPCGQYYAPAADTTGGIGFTFQIGGSGVPFTTSYGNGGLTMGAPSGTSSVYTLGLQAGAGTITESGAGALMVGTGNVCHWTFDLSGPLKPCVVGGGGTQSIGTPTDPVPNGYFSAVGLGAKQLYATATVTVSGVGAGATVTGNGTALVIVTANGAGITTTETLTMPAATTGYGCTADDLTTPADTGRQTAASLTSATAPAFTWSTAPTAGDKLKHVCVAY